MRSQSEAAAERRSPAPSAALAAAQAVLRARGIGGASPPRARPGAAGGTPGARLGGSGVAQHYLKHVGSAAATPMSAAAAPRPPAARFTPAGPAARSSPARAAVHDDSDEGESDGGGARAAPKPRRRYGPVPGVSSDSDTDDDGAAPRREAARRARGEAEARVRALSGVSQRFRADAANPRIAGPCATQRAALPVLTARRAFRSGGGQAA